MTLYNFTLMLSGVNIDTPRLEDALYESGCSDALVCFYGKSVYLEFDREAQSLDKAIESAIDNIEMAGIGAKVNSVDSALVGLSDIAELTHLSRQAIAMLKDGTRGSGDFPSPIQRIKGQSPLWDWAEVANWLLKSGRLDSHTELVSNAQVLSKWNLALRASACSELQQVEAITKKILSNRKKRTNCSNIESTT
ncbi:MULTISPECIES: helix-turn-helix transcriptional regulator [Providencia]|uniref:DNA-binding protein n=1 Tax=Providencia stuartii TaxID=588 RepID=A0A1S1HNA9_PROST|nr:DNA-binding protein [Providencia stuartii]OHT23745.1 DNA-binding protein [Providencia stuartii]